MNLQHVVKINGRVYEIQEANGNMLVLGRGKRLAVAFMRTGRLLQRHCLTGRFMSVRIK